MNHSGMFHSRIRFAIAGFAVLALGAALLSGCAGTGLGDVNIISLDEEWEMGRQLEEEIAGEMTVSTSAQLTRMGERIVAETALAGRDWRFYLVEDDSVNAFNVPGGLVYVHTGLLGKAAGEDELASVMAHEIGHGVARHGTQRLTRQYGLSVLAAAVLGEDPGVIQQIAARVVASGTIAQFSRAQEFEADEMGVEFSAAAGYDPRGMVTFLERLLVLRQSEPGAVEQFFATHPATEERIEAVKRKIQEL